MERLNSTVFLPVFFLFASFQFLPNHLLGQTVTEKMGGVKTAFIITSDNLNLDLLDQMIIKRGEGTYYAELSSDPYGEGGMGISYGIGKETFHLELMSFNAIGKRDSKQKGNRGRFLIQFYDNQNQPICNILVPPKDLISTVDSENPQFFMYSINLARVPLVILDHTKRINIVELSYKR